MVFTAQTPQGSRKLMMTRNFNFGNFFCRKCENLKLLFSLKLPRQIREITTFLFTRLRHKRRTIGRVIIDVCVWVRERECVCEIQTEKDRPAYQQRMNRWTERKKLYSILHAWPKGTIFSIKWKIRFIVSIPLYFI